MTSAINIYPLHHLTYEQLAHCFNKFILS